MWFGTHLQSLIGLQNIFLIFKWAIYTPPFFWATKEEKQTLVHYCTDNPNVSKSCCKQRWFDRFTLYIICPSNTPGLDMTITWQMEKWSYSGRWGWEDRTCMLEKAVVLQVPDPNVPHTRTWLRCAPSSEWRWLWPRRSQESEPGWGHSLRYSGSQSLALCLMGEMHILVKK